MLVKFSQLPRCVIVRACEAIELSDGRIQHRSTADSPTLRVFPGVDKYEALRQFVAGSFPAIHVDDNSIVVEL